MKSLEDYKKEYEITFVPDYESLQIRYIHRDEDGDTDSVVATTNDIWNFIESMVKNILDSMALREKETEKVWEIEISTQENLDESLRYTIKQIWNKAVAEQRKLHEEVLGK